MKNFTWSTIVVICFAFAKANTTQAQQDFKGIATYLAHTKFAMKEDSTMTKQAESDPRIKKLMEQLKKGSQQEYVLSFTRNESSYSKVEELARPTGDKGAISFSFGAGSGLGSTIYKDIAKNTFTKQGNIMGKDFVIEDKLPSYAWELQQETKKIGQYNCFKAIYKPVEKKAEEKEQTDKEKEEAPTGVLSSFIERDNTITAWYTPELAISNGPGEYHGLPGLILEITSDETVILCTAIEMNPSKGFELKIPKDGKKISQADFDALEKKKMDEMMEKQGGNKKGGFFIQTIGG